MVLAQDKPRTAPVVVVLPASIKPNEPEIDQKEYSNTSARKTEWDGSQTFSFFPKGPGQMQAARCVVSLCLAITFLC